MPLFLPSTDSTRKFWLSSDAGQTAAPGSTNELILAGCQYLMPPATLSSGKEVLLRIFGEKTGAALTNTVRLRVGTTGTLSDAALANSVQVNVALDTRTFGYDVALRVVSATTLRRHGPGGVGTSNGRSGQNTTARPAADTIPNVSNALYWTLTAQMSAATPEWVVINQFEIIVP